MAPTRSRPSGEALRVVGQFVEITSAELKPGQKNPKAARHEFTARFTKDDSVRFTIAFAPGDALVDGAHFDPSA